MDWVALTVRNARSVQTTIGWVYWEPRAVARYEALGIPGPLGYLASRSAPLAPAGPEAVVAAFGSLTPLGIALALDRMAQVTTPLVVWQARDEAIAEAMPEHAPGIVEPLRRLGPLLWPVVDRLPSVGRVLFAATAAMPRPEDPMLSGWHAVNCLREWRGDTHWVLVAAAGLTGVEASVLHNVWLGYDVDWLPKSRGSSEAEIDDAKASLDRRGLLGDAGRTLRQQLEDDTDRLTTLPWELLGEAESVRFHVELEPPCELLLRRVDETAGTNYQPGSRLRTTS